MKRILFGALTALLLFAAGEKLTFAQAPVVCEQQYTVAAGDWLSKLAEKYYGSVTAYPAIATQTNLKSETDVSYATIVNPDSIQVGWKLCIPNQDTANALNGVNAPAGLDKNALGNATYTSMVANGQVTFTNGKYEKQDDPNVPLMTQVMLTDQIAYGDINGVPSAAVVTGETGGGSGYFYLLHVMQAPDGKPTEVGYVLLGDRSPVIATIVQDNLAVVDMITQGPDQPFCCGTLRVVNRFKLEGNELNLASQNELGNLGPNGETPGQPLAVTGEVVYRERIAMPEGAVVKVQVADVSKADAPADVIGEQVIENPGNVPVPFTVPYDAAKIQPQYTYAVSARIEVNGKLMWISTTRIPVITNGAPTSGVTVLVQRVGDSTGSAASSDAAFKKLQGAVWKWQGTTTPVREITVDDPGLYTVEFTADGTVQIKADCNAGTATYTTDGSSITLGPIALTKAFCGEASQDTLFVAQLQNAAIYFFRDEDLMLDLKADAGTMRFSK